MTTVTSSTPLTIAQIEHEIVNRIITSHSFHPNTITIFELNNDSQIVIHEKLKEEMGNISFYQGKKEIFSNVQRTRRFQAVDAANDGKRATMILAPILLYREEFNDWAEIIRKKSKNFNKSPQCAGMKWIPPESGEHKQNLEVSNLIKVNVIKLAECFAELNASSFDEMREILRTFKNDRFGKAMETAKAINMFWNQLWGVFCGLFGAGKYAIEKENIGNISASGVQQSFFVKESNQFDFSFAFFATTDRVSSSQLAEHPYLCSQLVDKLPFYVEHKQLPSQEAIKNWFLFNEKGPFKKPTWWYNKEADPYYEPQITEFIKSQLTKNGFKIWPETEKILVKTFSRRYWMHSVCDIISEKFDRGTKLKLK